MDLNAFLADESEPPFLSASSTITLTNTLYRHRWILGRRDGRSALRSCVPFLLALPSSLH